MHLKNHISTRFISQKTLKFERLKKKAFNSSTIKSLTIPSSLIDLKEGWCVNALWLTKIKVSPDNPLYKNYKDKFVIGKSSIENDEFDVLVFCPRDVVSVFIPNFIRHIGPYAFYCCAKLDTILIPTNSELQTIGNHSFQGTAITSFTIPQLVTYIGKKAFLDCTQLQTIEIPNYSKLRTIDKKAFDETKIQNFTFPSKLIDLKEKWRHGAARLTKIDIHPKNRRYKMYKEKFIIGKSSLKQKNYDEIVFCSQDIKTVTIPNFIKYIKSCAFEGCSELRTINFSEDSELQTIEKYAFKGIPITNFKIPSHLKQIDDLAFSHCFDLQKIDFMKNSELKIIGKEAFALSLIEKITIPSSVIELKDGWCQNAERLNKIIIKPNNPRYKKYKENIVIGKSSIEQENYDTIVFCSRDIKKITIPGFIKYIESFSFNDCYDLTEVEIPKNSELQMIKQSAFHRTSIKILTIPPQLTNIGDNAFNDCEKLCKIKIPTNSKLQSIGIDAFSGTLIESFAIPSSVTHIGKYAFYCSHLKIIEIDDNSKIQQIENTFFYNNDQIIVMIPSKLSINII